MDTVHIARQQERNARLRLGDFYLLEHPDGEGEFAGSMSLDRAEELIKKMKMTRDSLVTSNWLPSTPPPPLVCRLERILTRPDKVKSMATAYMKWILSVQKLKRGQHGFLGWHYPVERARFVLTDQILIKMNKATITMEQLVPWCSLATMRNGLASGDISMLALNCGLTSWLAFLKVFLEVSIIEAAVCLFYPCPCSGAWWYLLCDLWCWRRRRRCHRLVALPHHTIPYHTIPYHTIQHQVKSRRKFVAKKKAVVEQLREVRGLCCTLTVPRPAPPMSSSLRLRTRWSAVTRITVTGRRCNCTEPHYTALHCTALTTLHCPALHCRRSTWSAGPPSTCPSAARRRTSSSTTSPSSSTAVLQGEHS